MQARKWTVKEAESDYFFCSDERLDLTEQCSSDHSVAYSYLPKRKYEWNSFCLLKCATAMAI